MKLHERQQLGVRLLPANLTYLGPNRIFQYTIISQQLCLSTNQLLSLKVLDACAETNLARTFQIISQQLCLSTNQLLSLKVLDACAETNLARTFQIISQQLCLSTNQLLSL
jgi:hypothetical protein